MMNIFNRINRHTPFLTQFRIAAFSSVKFSNICNVLEKIETESSRKLKMQILADQMDQLDNKALKDLLRLSLGNLKPKFEHPNQPEKPQKESKMNESIRNKNIA
jgi:hypothetical protein